MYAPKRLRRRYLNATKPVNHNESRPSAGDGSDGSDGKRVVSGDFSLLQTSEPMHGRNFKHRRKLLEVVCLSIRTAWDCCIFGGAMDVNYN